MKDKNQKDDLKNEAQDDLVFLVRVQYRRNTSWQGTIQWIDEKKSGNFRSVLELGNMIKDARCIRCSDKEKATLKWEEKEGLS